VSAVHFQVGARRFRLAEKESLELEQRLRALDDTVAEARDLADRIERARPRGHTVYPASRELAALRDGLGGMESSLSPAGLELLEQVVGEISRI